MKISLSFIVFLAILIVAVVTALVAFLPTYSVGVEGVEDSIGYLRRSTIARIDAELNLFFTRPSQLTTNIVELGRSGVDLADTLGANSGNQRQLYRYLCGIINELNGITPTVSMRNNGGSRDPDQDPTGRGLVHICDNRLGFTRVCTNIVINRTLRCFAWNLTTNDYAGGTPVALGAGSPYDSKQRELLAISKEGYANYYDIDNRWMPVSAGYDTIRFATTGKYIDRNGNTSRVFFGLLPNYLQNSLFNQLELTSGSRVMLVDAVSRRVFGTSWGEDPAPQLANWSNFRLPDEQRFRFKNTTDIEDGLIKKLTAALGGGDDAFINLPDVYRNTFFDGDDTTYVDVKRLTDPYGLDVRMVVAIPREDFTRKIDEQTTITIGAVAGALAVMLILAVIFSIQLARPLDDLGKRMYLTASLQDDGGKGTESTIKEIAAMQEAYGSMRGQLRQIKSFLPVGVLQGAHFEGEDAFVMGNSGSSSAPASNPLNASQDASSSLGRSTNAMMGGVFVERLRLDTNTLAPHDTMVCVITLAFNADPASPQAKQLLDSAFETILSQATKHRGVVETMKPHQVVVTFGARSNIGNPTMKALKAAARITDALNAVKSLEVSIVLDRLNVLVGVCGTEGHRQEVVYSEDIEALVSLGNYVHSHHRIAIAATQRVTGGLPRTTTAVPIDSIRFSSGERQTLYALSRKADNETAMSKAVREAFSLLQGGDSMEAIRLLDTFDGSEKEEKQVEYEHPPSHFDLIVKTAVATLSATASDHQNRGGSGTPYALRYAGWNGGDATTSAGGLLAPVFDSSREQLYGGRAQDQLKQLEDLQKKGRLEFSEVPDEETTGLFEVAVMSDEDGDDEEKRGGEALIVDNNLVCGTWRKSAGVLGAGAYGTVYRGLNGVGALGAIKVMPLVSKKASLEDLRRELSIVSQQRHENLVGYLDSNVTSEEVTVVMELLNGGSLDAILRDFWPLPIHVVKRFTTDMVRGLAHLHRSGVVHCDIKPQNVLVGTEGICKLADFGSAINSNSMMKESSTHREELHVRGTPAYMAPEIARGEQPTPASDIWSLGVLVHVLVTNEYPFNDQQRYAMRVSGNHCVQMIGRLSEKADPNSVKAPPAPRIVKADADTEAVAEFIAMCLRLDANARPSADEIAATTFLL